MSRHIVVLVNDRLRAKAVEYVQKARPGSRVEFKGPKRSVDQNAKMWACLSDIARQIQWHGLWLTADDWKLMFLDALKRVQHEELRLVPNLDLTGFVNLSTSTSDLDKEEMADLITLMLAWGDQHEVFWSEPEKVDHQPTPPIEAYEDSP